MPNLARADDPTSERVPSRKAIKSLLKLAEKELTDGPASIVGRPGTIANSLKAFAGRTCRPDRREPVAVGDHARSLIADGRGITVGAICGG